VLKVAQHLGIPALLEAVREYLLQDMVVRQAGRYADATLQAALLLRQRAPGLLPDLWRAAMQLPWGSPGLQLLLEEGLCFEEAAGVLRQKRSLGGQLCELQVLDCIRRLPSRRLALLQLPGLVDFEAMSALELEAVQRYAAAAAKQGSSASATPSAASSISGISELLPQSSSLASTCSAGDPGEQFWPAVLAAASSAYLDASLRPAQGLQLHSVELPKLEAGGWPVAWRAGPAECPCRACWAMALLGPGRGCACACSTHSPSAARVCRAALALGLPLMLETLKLPDGEYVLQLAAPAAAPASPAAGAAAAPPAPAALMSGEQEVGLFLRPRPRKISHLWASSSLDIRCCFLALRQRPCPEAGEEGDAMLLFTPQLEQVPGGAADGVSPGCAAPGQLSRWLQAPGAVYSSRSAGQRITVGVLMLPSKA
jgi:hypothetical protein